MIQQVLGSLALLLLTLIPLALGARTIAPLRPPSRRDWWPAAAPGPETDLDLTRGLPPPGPIDDASSYRDAVAILDRLFALDRPQTPDERRYFRALAERVHEFEFEAEDGRGGPSPDRPARPGSRAAGRDRPDP